jgi:hypothetical protein
MNKQKSRFLGLAVSLLGAALLASCGGGDGGGPTAAQLSAGLWTGSTDTNRNVTAVTLSDGTYYLMYDGVGTPGTPGGLVAGSDGALSSTFTFTSTDALDHDVETGTMAVPVPAIPATVRADAMPRTSFNGTMARTNGTGFNFSTSYDADFNSTPTLLAVQGTYTGTVGFSLGPRAGSVFVVDANGGITSTINFCSITGRLTPRTDGNIYDLSITFGGGYCAFPNQTLTGIAYYRALTRELRTATTGVATLNPGAYPGDTPNPEGVVFIGTKPL